MGYIIASCNRWIWWLDCHQIFPLSPSLHLSLCTHVLSLFDGTCWIIWLSVPTRDLRSIAFCSLADKALIRGEVLMHPVGMRNRLHPNILSQRVITLLCLSSPFLSPEKIFIAHWKYCLCLSVNFSPLWKLQNYWGAIMDVKLPPSVLLSFLINT